jgi:hypothetical protein
MRRRTRGRLRGWAARRSQPIIEHRWHEEPNGTLPTAVYEETAKILAMPDGEQLELWEE